MTNHRSVAVVGLPGSGKTTFLAALWHLIFERSVPMCLRYHNLVCGEMSHLNAITARWRSAIVQERTFVSGNRAISLNLQDDNSNLLRVTFPDIAGEEYSQMWEDRECDTDVADMLREGGVLLFIHADGIKPPLWVADVAAIARQLGTELEPGQTYVHWHPKLAPTQVKIIGLLSLLREQPLDSGPRRLAVMFSAWDKAQDAELSPEAYLAAKLPLLHQYLRQAAHQWDWRVYGVSAQGGDYDDPQNRKSPKAPGSDALRALDSPSERIQLVHGDSESRDLTEPLKWLMS